MRLGESWPGAGYAPWAAVVHALANRGLAEGTPLQTQERGALEAHTVAYSKLNPASGV
jgi:hypothetical protein